MLKAIVFDFDGVLVDSEPLHFRALRRVTEPFGCDFGWDRYLDRYIGFDDRDALRAILGDFGRPEANDPARIAELVARKGDAFEAVVAEGVSTYDGTVEFVRRAAAELPVAVSSGATRRDIDLILGRLGLTGVFDPIVSADMVARSKPDPETYRLAVEGIARRASERNVAPAECLAIEDTAAGIASARGAGLRTLGLTTTAGPEALREAERVVGSLGTLRWDDLLRWY